MEDRTVPSFIAPINYDIGPDPANLAVGDFNGDGIPDLVTYNSAVFGGTPSLSVLLGKGDGTFQPAIFNYSVAGISSSLAVADLVGNGLSDLVVTLPNGNLGVLLSNGDGTFRAPIPIRGTNGVPAPVLEDLNGDGLPDLVAAGDGVKVFLNNGDGTFQSPTRYALPVGSALTVAIGDFNGDGIPDIVVRDSGVSRPPRMLPGFDVLMGNGDGTFQDPIRTEGAPPDPLFKSLVVADLNGDNASDLVIVSRTAPTISVRLSNGDGTFQDAVAYSVGQPVESVTVMDVNGDGIPDLVAPSGRGVLKVLLNNGDGTFRAGQDVFVGPDISSLVVFADFNQDGATDLASILDVNHGVGVRLGNPDGTFQTTSTIAAGPHPWGAVVGDFNGDGIPDFAVANAFTENHTVSVFLGNGDGTFQAARTFDTGPDPTSLVTGDFNHDGKLDLVVEDDQGVKLYLGNGDGTFRAPTVISTTPGDLAVGDFNGDGNPDLLLVDNSTVRLLLGNGDGTFRAPTVIFNIPSQPVPVEFVTGDFNGDHKLDLAVLNWVDGSVNVLLGNGDGTFQAAQNYAVGSYPQHLTAADLTGAGRDDLVVTRDGDEKDVLPGFVSVLLSNADGSFRPAVNYQIGSDPGPVVVADFTGDGRPDIAVMEGSRGESASMVRLLPGNGDGTFQINPFTYSLGSSIGNNLVMGDFNRDGFPDLLATNSNDFTVSVLLNGADWTGPRPGGGGGRPDRSSALAVALNSERVSNLTALPTPLAPANVALAVPAPDPTITSLDSLFAASSSKERPLGVIPSSPRTLGRSADKAGAALAMLDSSLTEELFLTLIRG